MHELTDNQQEVWDRLKHTGIDSEIAASLQRRLQFFTGMSNNAATQIEVEQSLCESLNHYLDNREIYDYTVVCDAGNNTVHDVTTNRLNVDVFIKPTRAADIININLTIK